MEPNQVIDTQQDIQVLSRPVGSVGTKATAWQEIGRGPGRIQLPEGQEIGVRIKGIGDKELKALVNELVDIPQLIYLNLSENRNITDTGLPSLRLLPRLRWLNLSSCSLTTTGLTQLKGLTNLEILDLSYCNRLTDLAAKTIKTLTGLTFLDLQGCVKITHGGLSHMERRGLTIHK